MSFIPEFLDETFASLRFEAPLHIIEGRVEEFMMAVNNADNSVNAMFGVLPTEDRIEAGAAVVDIASHNIPTPQEIMTPVQGPTILDDNVEELDVHRQRKYVEQILNRQSTTPSPFVPSIVDNGDQHPETYWQFMNKTQLDDDSDLFKNVA